MLVLGVFASGQSYVALSRARSLKCLQVVDFNLQKSFRVNPICVAFTETLRQINTTDCVIVPIATTFISPTWQCPSMRNILKGSSRINDNENDQSDDEEEERVRSETERDIINCLSSESDDEY